MEKMCPVSCIQIEIFIHLFSETYILILGGDLRTSEDSKDEYRTQCGCYDFDSNVACDDCFDPESYPSPPLVSYFEIEEPFRLPSEIMKITFEEQTNRITSVECSVMPDYDWLEVGHYGDPRGFLNASFGNFNGRSLAMGGVGRFGRCFEFSQEPALEDDPYQTFKNHFIFSKTKLRVEELPCLNKNRCGAASIFSQHKILILGGFDDDTGHKLDSIEILDLGQYNHGYEWIKSPSRLPINVSMHTVLTCDKKLYLIGGDYEGKVYDLSSSHVYDYDGVSDKVWEGIFDLETSKVTWVKILKLQKKRSRHFSFVISHQIIIFGGCNGDDDEEEDFVEIIEGSKLKQGPQVPFKLSTINDRVVLDRTNRFIIISKEYGLIVYDYENGTFNNYQKEFYSEYYDSELMNYVAFLQ